MYDSLEPGSVILEQNYERGYRLWHELYLASLADPLDVTALDLQHAFPRHPSFIPELHLDTRSRDVLYATGTSTWETSTGGCSLPSFEKRYKIPVTAKDSLIVSLPLHRNSFGQDSDHIAWAVWWKQMVLSLTSVSPQMKRCDGGQRYWRLEKGGLPALIIEERN
ncbi:hypothetical protein E4U22_001574 [Claviceps purpurea]|nr:hypothetical protein E4U22_001574 [Claviceps purpurea]